MELRINCVRINCSRPVNLIYSVQSCVDSVDMEQNIVHVPFNNFPWISLLSLKIRATSLSSSCCSNSSSSSLMTSRPTLSPNSYQLLCWSGSTGYNNIFCHDNSIPRNTEMQLLRPYRHCKYIVHTNRNRSSFLTAKGSGMC